MGSKLNTARLTPINAAMLSVESKPPDVAACAECGGTAGEFFFDIMGGFVECAACRRRKAGQLPEGEELGERRIIRILTEGAKAALDYCIHSPLERLFSFKLSGENEEFFENAAEDYLVNQLERSFKTLDFYNQVKR